MTSKKHVYILTLMVLVGVLIAYFYQFHNGLSQSPSDWGNFADYICGLLTPLLALLNIIVFIDLTKSIENNRLAVEKAKDKEQELRHQRDIEHQKQMLVFQLRVEEVRRFDSVLENVFCSNADEYHGGIPLSMVKAATYIESFIRNKIDLFDFKSDKEQETFINKLKDGHHILNELLDKMVNSEHTMTKSDLIVFLDFKADIIKWLYIMTLNRL